MRELHAGRKQRRTNRLNTSPPVHFFSGSGRLSSQAGFMVCQHGEQIRSALETVSGAARTIIRLHTHPVSRLGPKQVAISRTAVSTSWPNAETASTIVVPRSDGQMGSQSAHASGSGRLASRAWRDSLEHKFPQVRADSQVNAGTSSPLNIPPSTMVRGKPTDESATPESRKSSPTRSTRVPQKGADHPRRPVHPRTP